MNKTRKTIWFVLSICFICMIFTMPVSAKGKNVAKKNMPEKIVLNRTELLLYPGEERKLRVEYIKPEKASAKVVWESKRKAVAAISPKGELKARKPGKTIITAVSKKNSKVKAVVKVTVKKRPQKKEKECAVEGRRYSGIGSEKFGGLNEYARVHHLEVAIFRSKEDIQAYIKEAYKKYYKRNGKLPQTFLSEYFKTNFNKESVAVFFYRSDIVTSLQTKFDEDGKLRGIIGIRYQPPELSAPEGANWAVSRYHATVLKISKQDEAMIDYYEFQVVNEG